MNERKGGQFAAVLRLPRVSLPMGGATVTMNLESVLHRELTEPPAPGSTPPPIGFDVVPLDRLEIALDPHVLVLPVRVHRFVRPGTAPTTANASHFRQTLDPAAAETLRALIDSNPYSSSVTVESGRLRAPVAAPDDIWTQCDIQFHLESYEEIVQTDGLEVSLTGNCACAGTSGGLWGADNGAIAPYLQALPVPERAIDVFVGGAIFQSGRPGVSCGPGTRAVTCGPSTTAIGGGCGAPGDRHGHNFVLIHDDALRTDPQVLAHELGHYLGLAHSSAAGGAQCLDPTDTGGIESTLLMSPLATGSTVTASQCARARCIAAHWLATYGSLSLAQRDTVCAE